MAFEEETLNIEREKLEIERYKANLEASKTKWTAVSVSVPVVVATLTVAYGIWTARETARIQFELEAVKTVLQAANPVEANNKMFFFKKFFPKQLSETFAEITKQEVGLNVDGTAKKALFDALAASKELSVGQTLALWRALFPGYGWAKDKAVSEAVLLSISQQQQTSPDEKNDKR